jgi:hypothetical protein
MLDFRFWIIPVPALMHPRSILGLRSDPPLLLLGGRGRGEGNPEIKTGKLFWTAMIWDQGFGSRIPSNVIRRVFNMIAVNQYFRGSNRQNPTRQGVIAFK